MNASIFSLLKPLYSGNIFKECGRKKHLEKFWVEKYSIHKVATHKTHNEMTYVGIHLMWIVTQHRHNVIKLTI